MHEQLVIAIEIPRLRIQPVKLGTMQERFGRAEGKCCGDCALVVVNDVYDLVGPVKAFRREAVLCGICLQKVRKSSTACGRFESVKEGS